MNVMRCMLSITWSACLANECRWWHRPSCHPSNVHFVDIVLSVVLAFLFLHCFFLCWCSTLIVFFVCVCRFILWTHVCVWLPVDYMWLVFCLQELEVVDSEPRNWKGIAIALIVIVCICAVISGAILILSPRKCLISWYFHSYTSS